MDDSITPDKLYQALSVFPRPLIIDVRRRPAFEAAEHLIPGALRRDPELVADWAREVEAGRRVVVYCVHGHEVSQAAAAELRAAGVDARYLEGGIAGWVELGLATRRKIGAAPSKWVTRERPTIDRIACPWLVSRFIDPEAEFIYVPSPAVIETAGRTGATPYDVANAEFGHHGELCSFDAFIRIYGIADAALDRLALIVRGADTGRPDLTPQSPGLLAVSQGLKINFTDDHAMLAHGMIVYDALYAWCRAQIAKPRA